MQFSAYGIHFHTFEKGINALLTTYVIDLHAGAYISLSFVECCVRE